MTKSAQDTGPKINHLGIVVPDLAVATALYRLLGFEVAAPITYDDQGIAKSFIRTDNFTIELIAPTVSQSPLKWMLEDQNASDFLQRNPNGGLHHLCLTVPDLSAVCDALAKKGYRLLGEPGPSGSAIAWVDPASADGVLVELKQRAVSNAGP